MNDKKYLKLNDIESYIIAFNLSNYVWELVSKWNSLPKSIHHLINYTNNKLAI